MTKTLHLLFMALLGFIVIFWIGDLFAGIPADVSDRAVSEDWVDNNEHYRNELSHARFRTLIYAIPILILLVLTIISKLRNNELLFYWTFLIGLTQFQLILTAGFFNVHDNDPAFFKPLIVSLFTLFLIGQIISIFKLIKLKQMKKQQKLS